MLLVVSVDAAWRCHPALNWVLCFGTKKVRKLVLLREGILNH